MMDNTKAFLGRGFSFPPQIDEATGRFVMCSEEEDIRQSIYLILMTRKKERAMMPDFGCDLHEYVFGLPESTSLSLAVSEIVEALTKWEPRIVDIDVDADVSRANEGKIFFDIQYVVRATNHPGNFVFPYYLYEGTGLD